MVRYAWLNAWSALGVDGEIYVVGNRCHGQICVVGNRFGWSDLRDRGGWSDMRG